jgi:hypothetical protein
VRFTEKKTVKNGSLLNSFEEKLRSFGQFLTSFGHFLNGKGQVVKRITPAGELKTGVVKRNGLFIEKKIVVFGVPGGKKVSGFGKKRAFVEKTTFVFERIMGVRVGGNWVRLG